MDLSKKCCETCADEECRRQVGDLAAFLRYEYCVGNNYCLWLSKERPYKESMK